MSDTADRVRAKQALPVNPDTPVSVTSCDEMSPEQYAALTKAAKAIGQCTNCRGPAKAVSTDDWAVYCGKPDCLKAALAEQAGGKDQ